MTIEPAPPRMPADQAERDRIISDLDANLFVEAGAGSGKTTALVDRVLALVATGTAELAAIAAITFTDKAAAELRDRIRRRLEQRAAQAEDPAVGARCALALDQLDGAAIGTLHAFARRLLAEHPVEARLPPRVDVLDEVTSGIEFDRRWAAFRDRLLDDPHLQRTIVLLLAAGVGHEALRALAAAFDDNWDLVEERVPPDAPEPPPLHLQLADWFRAVDAVWAERTACTDAADKLLVRLGEIATYADRLRTIEDEIDLLEALGPGGVVKAPSFLVGNVGKPANWRLDLADLKARVRAVGEAAAAVRDTIARACVGRIASAVRAFTLASAAERRAAGRLEFHDLLVLARSLVRDPEHGAAVREWLHQRYQRLLLDEFQDTDPIQIELAVRIASADPAGVTAGAGPWLDVELAPGHLFVVGDPKQSIYRFRRADISVFLAARQRFGIDADALVELTSNFRTGEAVIDWVNHTFSALMAETPDVDLPVPSQPDYVPLTAVRRDSGGGPSVAVLGRAMHPKRTTATDLRAAEADDVVATVIRAVREGWLVGDAAGGWRSAGLADITILVPARTSLPFLEASLERASMPYRAESSSLIYASRAVRDLLMVLRAVDDPTNLLAIATALRTPLLACGDDDLFRFKVERGGHWNYLGDQPAGVPADDPVALGLAYLRTLHDVCRWRTPSELLDQICRDRRALELGFADWRPRDAWRRLRFVIDQARGWSEAAGGTLREYLYWVELQSAEGARVADAVLPETDDNAVRIMTIHAAKGLEFPITILSGLSSVPSGRRASAEVVFPPTGGVGYRFGSRVSTQEFEVWKPLDEQMGFHERIRLLYVAATRARDHLVVSLHRKERSAPLQMASARTSAELLVDGMGDGVLQRLPDAVGAPMVLPAVVTVRPPAPPPFEEWEREREAALARARRPSAIAATALKVEYVPAESDAGASGPAESGAAGPGAADPGLQKRPRDLDLPPWLKGRYGTSIGRAVHAVLQSIDLATGDGLDAAVAAQCEAEAVPGRTGDVRRLVLHALSSPSVREAAASAHWREVYACAPVAGGRLLEGYVDLLYRAPDGLVVVDYKTASSSDPVVLDERMAGYRLQGASYALAVAEATGEVVRGVVFVFLTPTGPVERSLQDLKAAVADVIAAVSSGQEVYEQASVP